MPDREQVLSNIRSALGRRVGQPAPDPPPSRIVVPQWSREERIRRFSENFRGETFVAPSADEARDFVAEKIDGCETIASKDEFLCDLGLVNLPDVRVNVDDPHELRVLCATAGAGLTGATYAIADPGALAVLAGNEEERLISLLPPRHVAVLPAHRVLTSLDELFAVLPDPALESSSLVLIGGPSRTGDIEMSLTLGVHGPREVYVVII